MQQRKYMNISRVKTKDLPGIRVGDHIVVQEKIDGANFSIIEESYLQTFSHSLSLSDIAQMAVLFLSFVAFEMFLEEYNTNKLQVPNARLSFI